MKKYMIFSFISAMLACLLMTSNTFAQRKNFYLQFELPKPMDIGRAFQVLGIPHKHFDQLTELTDEQKEKIIEMAQDLQDKLLEKAIATMDGDAKKMMENYRENAVQFGPELGLLDLTDQQKKDLQKVFDEYSETLEENKNSYNATTKARRKLSEKVQEILTEEQTQLLIKIKYARAFQMQRQPLDKDRIQRFRPRKPKPMEPKPQQ